MAEITRNGVERMLKRLERFGKEAMDELLDDILAILTSEDVERAALTPRERADIIALIKGRYTPQAFFNALQVAARILEDQRKALPAREVLKPVERRVQFGVELVPSMSLDKVVEYARRFELGGADFVWITDHYTNRDPYVTLSLIARATDVMNLGVGVTNPYTRHIASTASAVASLDELSEGRAALGLGPGDRSTLAALNIELEKPLTRVKETVLALRALWSGEPVRFDGKTVRLEGARMSFRPPNEIPIYIGAQGPKMLRLAGEIGDGVLINASNEKDFELASKNIKSGVEAANRKLKDVDVVAYTCFSVAESEADAKKAATPVVAFIAAGSPENVLERHGLDVEKANKMKELISKGKIPDAFALVDDDFIEAFSVSGTPEQCINKIETLLKAGVTQFVFGSPLGKKKKDALQLITEKVMPAFTA
ncbi:5,10-methylenetetrahydromethanopterin reductase [Candidatus Alkanophaga liquidiphilum]|nr:Flavin-dependent oxidoreductase [Candidatus Alkanophaga liquidiphilum]